MRARHAAAVAIAAAAAAACSPASPSDDAQLRSQLTAAAWDLAQRPGTADLHHVDVDADLHGSGAITFTLTADGDGCWTTAVTLPASWLIDGDGTGDVAPLQRCPPAEADGPTADHAQATPPAQELP